MGPPPVTLDQTRWSGLWFRLGAQGDGDSTFQQLAAAYAQPWRAYHGAEHLQECLAELDRNRTLARRPDVIEAALWFHDAVYVPGKPDNEDRSAHLAESSLAAAGVPLETARRVAELVLATRHVAPAAEPDAQLACDIDLAILGKEPAAFDVYEGRIRQEYDWVPEPLYRRSRSAVLRALLRRPAIYQTDTFVDRYELPARKNLERTLTALTP